MKKLMLKVALLIIPIITFWGCQNTTNELSESEKDSIIEEVRIEFEKAISAATNHDADEMTSYWWDNEDFLYASNGSLIKGWEPGYEVANSIHSNPKYQSFSVDLDEVLISVINEGSAMVSAVGYFNNYPSEEGPRSIKLALTFLMQKIDGNWVITVGHESTPEDLSNL